MLERILVKATPKPPDMTRDCLSTVFSCFYWAEEFTIGAPRPCACTMSFKKSTHNVEILAGLQTFKEVLEKTARLAASREAEKKKKKKRAKSTKNNSGKNTEHVQDVVDEVSERRRQTVFKLHAHVAAAVFEYFSLVKEDEAAAHMPIRMASDDAENARDERMTHLSIDERRRLRASLRRLEIYESVLAKHPTLFNNEQRQARMRRASFGFGKTLSMVEGDALSQSKPRRSWQLSATSKTLLVDLIQDVFFESQAFITNAKQIMVNYSRLPTQPLRRNRLKLNPQNHVRVLTFLYAGSLSLAAAKMLGPTSAETFVAIVFFLVYGVFLNFIIWHHFIKYVVTCRFVGVVVVPLTHVVVLLMKSINCVVVMRSDTVREWGF